MYLISNYKRTRTHTHTHTPTHPPTHARMHLAYRDTRTMNAYPSARPSIHPMSIHNISIWFHMRSASYHTLCFHHRAALAANPCSAWLRLSNCVTAIQDGLDATLLDSTWLFKAIRVDTWKKTLYSVNAARPRLQTFWCKATQEIANEGSADTTQNNNDVLQLHAQVL